MYSARPVLLYISPKNTVDVTFPGRSVPAVFVTDDEVIPVVFALSVRLLLIFAVVIFAVVIVAVVIFPVVIVAVVMVEVVTSSVPITA